MWIDLSVFIFTDECDLCVVDCVVYDDFVWRNLCFIFYFLLNVSKDEFFSLVVIADVVSELFAGYQDQVPW